MLDDAQALGECLGGFRVRIGEDGHSLHHGDEGSHEERGGLTPPPEGDEPCEDVVVVSH